MDILAELSELGLLGTGLSQHGRMITLTSAQERGLPEALMAECLRGREAVNELFDFHVDALSVSTDLALDQFIGEELTIALLQPDGGRRAWHGLCTEAAWQGADGGVARYRLRLQPALVLLGHRRDCYIFQDKTVQEIVTELLSDYDQIRFDFDVTQTLAPRALVTQYRESDLDFMTRILASEGLSWRFEHDQAGDEAAAGDGHSKHRLVIFDSMAKLPDLMGNAALRFHGVRATDTDDAIDEFRARRQVQANAVSISSWDFEQLVAPSAEQESSLDAGTVPTLPVYDGSGELIASGAGEAEAHSVLMLQALELENKTFEGAGAVRRMAAGHVFELTQHERYGYGQSSFKILSVDHHARNNFDSQIRSARDGIEPGTYRNEFTCVRDTVAIVPRAIAAPNACTAPGPQTAIVVGLASAVATTQRDHQVKVQFAWQRGQNPNAGGIGHDVDAKGSAPGDETSGTWVRVSEALAGPNWGTQFTPRIGIEVLVDFIEGDIDRPVVVAQLYTGSDLPPFAAGVDSGANHPGTLSGIHSHNFDRSGYNQLQLDDTAGQVRTRLATSTAASQLNLGYLVAQQPASSHRGGYRGSGFELRTDAWGVVRGGDGVLLSTTARSQVGSGVTSTQMDTSEAVSLLKGAQDLVRRLGDAAAQQQALSSDDAAAAQKELIDRLDPAVKGKFGGLTNGQDASKAKDGGRDPDPSKPVEKFGASTVVMESPTSVNFATPASTVLFAGQQLQWTTQSDLHFASAHTVSSVAANAAGFFTHAGGISAIAANGPVSLQSHTDQLEILADKALTVISVNEGIKIDASRRITLRAGSSSITLDGKDITFTCPGEFTVKGGEHRLDGGEMARASFTPLPSSDLRLFDRRIRLSEQSTGDFLPNTPYFLRLEGGVVFFGTTDNEGFAQQIYGDSPENATLYTGHAAMIEMEKYLGTK